MMIADKYLCCCITQQEREEIELEIADGKYAALYRHQERFVKEKHGYRCTACGAVHPYLRIEYEGTQIDPNVLSKPSGKVWKYKKAAEAYFADRYYARNRKSLLKFEMDAEGNMHLTDETPVMGGVYHTRLSGEERYLATETMSGTIGIVDIRTKELIAKKTKCGINGAFAFAQEEKLLYFYQNAIRCWDFLTGEEKVLWQTPGPWNRTVCRHVTYNSRNCSHVFQLSACNEAYAVAVSGTAVAEPVQLPKMPVLSKLEYAEGLDCYTIAASGEGIVFDGQFGLVGTVPYPYLVKHSDGGGFFPVTRFGREQPQCIFFSPDGKWILLDYFTAVILMKAEGYAPKFCLFSYTGKTAQHMGFTDDGHFWYTWGDTTYVQELPR